MRKIFFIVLPIIFLSISLAYAAPNIGGGLTSEIAEKGGYDTAGVTDTSFSASIGQIIKVALSFVGTIFFALTIYAGFLWMTASGNEEQVTKATEIIKMAIIGLVITLAAYSITTFVLIKVISSSTAGNAAVGK